MPEVMPSLLAVVASVALLHHSCFAEKPSAAVFKLVGARLAGDPLTPRSRATVQQRHRLRSSGRPGARRRASSATVTPLRTFGGVVPPTRRMAMTLRKAHRQVPIKVVTSRRRTICPRRLRFGMPIASL